MLATVSAYATEGRSENSGQEEKQHGDLLVAEAVFGKTGSHEAKEKCDTTFRKGGLPNIGNSRMQEKAKSSGLEQEPPESEEAEESGHHQDLEKRVMEVSMDFFSFNIIRVNVLFVPVFNIVHSNPENRVIFQDIHPDLPYSHSILGF